MRLVELGDGSGRGVRILEFRTGTGFEFEVLVDRGFDIGRCEFAGRSLAWLSGVGVEGPTAFEPEGLGWLRGFGGGLLVTCGLDHALFMAEDSVEQYHYPGRSVERYGLHGRISYRPARLTSYGERWDGDECVLFAEGQVLQASVFGEHLLLQRRIETRLGESRLTLCDVVRNLGWNDTPHMFLYHVNAGYPVVDEGAEIVVPGCRVAPFGVDGAGSYRTIEPPSAGFVEQIFEHEELQSEVDGAVPVGVVNRELGLGLYQVFRIDQLPHHFVWRMLGEGTYVVGIEPGTNRVAGRMHAREAGELIMLAPDESRHYDLELGALVGDDEIASFTERVAAIV